ncbi:MAG: OmpH family outer membrane protein [Verrucomicrobia bacterium]|nr:OmpH family outer membrane protein [Verrucomicrobiota bacterium]
MSMNKHRFVITFVAAVAVLAAGWAPQTASAQSAKIGALEMRKLYEEFYKTKVAQRSFDESVAAYRRDYQQRVNDYNKLNEDYQKMREESNNPALTQEKRDQKAKQVQDKVLELRKSLEALKEFEQNSQQYLNDLRRRQNDAILKEILEAVRKKGRDGGYTVIVDSSGFGTAAGVPMAVYADEKLDFTDVILKELNANAPATLPSSLGPGPGTLPSPSTTPRTPAPAPAP